MSNENRPSKWGSKKLIFSGLGILLVVILAVGGLCVLKRSHIQKEERARDKQAKAGPGVETAVVEKSPPFREVVLIGEARPFYDVVIYARAAGYLKSIPVDKGDHVKENQILAEIESPETDKALISALSDSYNKSRIAYRAKVLRKKQLISQQEADLAISNGQMAEAFLETQRVLKNYEQVRAPFDGTIINRFVDPGALLQNATSSSSAAGTILELAQTTRLRVYTYPDQADAALVKNGTEAEISLPNSPLRKFKESVTRTSESLDSKTRKLLAEIDMDNSDLEIVPGSFVQVQLHLQEKPELQVPAQAITMREGKTMIPLIDAGNKVHYKEVRVTLNDGQKIQFEGELKEGEKVALNIGNSINEGQVVQAKAPTALAGQAKHSTGK